PDFSYYGDRLQLICGTNGEAIGSYNNARWHYAKNLSRPEAGVTWIPDRYLNTPNKANRPTPGERECGSTGGTTSTGSNSTSNTHKSVFFSPNDTPTGQNGIKSVADVNIPFSQWASGGCTSDKVLDKIPAGVDTLSGWSRGRLGPIYFLQEASPERQKQIHNIVLFDPGSTSDMAGKDILGHHFNAGCDLNYDVNSILASWLKSDGSNRLTIIAGNDTEMKADPGNPKSNSTFQGLWKYYLADIWNKPFANRAQICDYNSMEHSDTLRNFAWMAKAPQAGCVAMKGYQLTAWHP
ncbi:MAG TPA: hypothetical protein VF809_03105, partial [Candidatus Saccharimonadales bacterium]